MGVSRRVRVGASGAILKVVKQELSAGVDYPARLYMAFQAMPEVMDGIPDPTPLHVSHAPVSVDEQVNAGSTVFVGDYYNYMVAYEIHVAQNQRVIDRDDARRDVKHGHSRKCAKL